MQCRFSLIYLLSTVRVYIFYGGLGARGLTIEYVVAAVKGGECGVCTVAQGEGIVAVEGSESGEDLVVRAFGAVGDHVFR